MKEFTFVINKEMSGAIEEISNGRAEVLLIPKGEEIKRYLDERGIKAICGVLIPRTLSELEKKVSLLPF